MDLGRLLNPSNPMTPPHQFLLPAHSSGGYGTHLVHSNATSQQIICTSVDRAAFQGHQGFAPLNPTVSQVTKHSGSQHDAVKNSYETPIQALVANHGVEETFRPGSLLGTHDQPKTDASVSEQTPRRDAAIPPAPANVVTYNHINDEKGEIAVIKTKKRQKKDADAVPAAINQSYEPPTLGPSQPRATARRTNSPQPQVPLPTKPMTRLAALGLGLGARPRNLTAEGLLPPAELLPASVASNAKVQKRKRVPKPKEEDEKSESSSPDRVWRANLEKTEIGTFGGWVAFRRVEGDGDGEGRDFGTNASRGKRGLCAL